MVSERGCRAPWAREQVQGRRVEVVKVWRRAITLEMAARPLGASQTSGRRTETRSRTGKRRKYIDRRTHILVEPKYDTWGRAQTSMVTAWAWGRGGSASNSTTTGERSGERGRQRGRRGR
eukprot:4866936-Heterocapsa_arctica.AAC.1